jgi:hypothetical protein
MKAIQDLEGEIDERRRLAERRFTSRRKILRTGKTFWPNGDSAECVVHNFSAIGAKLKLVGSVPNTFDLLIDGDLIRRPCSVIWRKEHLVGVKFLITAELAPAVDPAKKPTGGFRRYVEACESLAQRASPSDRQILHEMAGAWKKAIRLLRARER